MAGSVAVDEQGKETGELNEGYGIVTENKKKFRWSGNLEVRKFLVRFGLGLECAEIPRTLNGVQLAFITRFGPENSGETTKRIYGKIIRLVMEFSVARDLLSDFQLEKKPHACVGVVMTELDDLRKKMYDVDTYSVDAEYEDYCHSLGRIEREKEGAYRKKYATEYRISLIKSAMKQFPSANSRRTDFTSLHSVPSPLIATQPLTPSRIAAPLAPSVIPAPTVLESSMMTSEAISQNAVLATKALLPSLIAQQMPPSIITQPNSPSAFSSAVAGIKKSLKRPASFSSPVHQQITNVVVQPQFVPAVIPIQSQYLQYRLPAMTSAEFSARSLGAVLAPVLRGNPHPYDPSGDFSSNQGVSLIFNPNTNTFYGST